MPTIKTDVAIIGSGFGGAGCAQALTQAGLDVVLIERGGHVARDEADWDPKTILIDKRYKSNVAIEIDQREGKAPSVEHPNETVGGGSIFYGGAALRLREKDFGAWPLSYGDFAPYYARAEKLQGVRGEAGADPHEPPREGPYPFPPNTLTKAASRIDRAARKLGMKPFRIPMAIHYPAPAGPSDDGGREACVSCFTCDGFPCKIGAKNDTEISLLGQADQSRLKVYARTVAGRLLHDDKGHVTALECHPRDGGEVLRVEAERYIVSGGAVHSPAILLRSGLERYDRSGLLGRQLMRHCNAMIGALFPFRINPEQSNHKQICLSDLYEDVRDRDGTAVGLIQDMCMPPKDAVRYLAPAGFRYAAATFSSFIQSVICVAEDKPRHENRVFLGSSKDAYGLEQLRIHHRYGPDDLARLELLVERAKRLLRKAGGLFTKRREVDSFSHAVGSVRFGDAPEKAPLNLDCRLWDVDNVYVVDGSFFPTSGGVNPSLTILANALRVSETIAKS